jgi:hypothetical protein
MSLLENIIAKPTPSAPKGIVYGPPGIGKTTFGAGATDALIIDCENGAGAIQCQRTPYLSTWSEISQWLTAIEREDHPYKTLVIDSIDWLLRRVEEQVAGSEGKIDQTLNRSHGGYGNGKQVMKNYVYQTLLPQLDHIVNHRGIAVIMLAHAKRNEITDVDGITTEKTTAELPYVYLYVFVEWSDWVCLARKDGDNNRVLITQETSRALVNDAQSNGMTSGIP